MLGGGIGSLTDSGGSFVSQRQHWINFGRSSGRDVAGKQSDYDEHCHGGEIGKQVRRVYAK
jgi:hypothetical protein